MRWQTTAVLAVVLAALGAFFYMYEVRLAPDRDKAESVKGRIFTAELADVTEVVVERPDTTLRARREGDGWQVLEPVKTRGDRNAIDDLVTTVTTAKSDREIEPSPTAAALADFGLEKPAARVTLALKNGRRVGLTVGAKSPTGAWVYVRETDKPAVLAVGEGVLRDSTRPVADFRDKTVVALGRGDVTGIEVATPDDTLVFAQADRKWRLVRPRPLPADGDVVRDFLEKAAAAKVKEFIADAPASLAPFALDRPTRVTFTAGGDKNRSTTTLLFGRVDAGKKGVYVMRQGEPTVMLIPEDVWTAVPKTVATARDKTVVDFDRDRVAKVEVQSPKGAVTLVRQDNRWKITAPEALPADQVEAGGLLFKLKDLKAQAFLSEDASGVSRYLAKPEVSVTITENGGTPKTVLVASSGEKRGGQPSAVAAVAGRGPVVLVDAKALDGLAKSVTDLRDHTLLGSMEPKDVKRLSVKAGSQSILLEKSGDAWKVLEPAKGGAKEAKVEDLLYTLRALKWKDIVAPTGADAAKYGLDAPSFAVTLYRPDGGEIGTLLVGRREADRAYVKTKASPTIYAVDPKLLGDLPKIPDDLKS